MDALRLGRSIRVLRLRTDKRQEDVGRQAGVSRQVISRIESGDIDGMTLATIRRVADAVGADVQLTARWHGEGLDRLLDAAHAGLVERVVRLLQDAGWETAVEVSFSIAGERGSVDVVGLRRDTGSVLIVEVKTVVPDAGGMLMTLDRKARLAPRIARQLGWPCESVSRLLVIGDSSTTRRRVAALDATFQAALPARGWAVKRWLRQPAEVLAGILFLPFASGTGRRRSPTGRQRVRRPRSGRQLPRRRPGTPSGNDGEL
jgi:transcriptional regulator with XRE-family HTH domain